MLTAVLRACALLLVVGLGACGEAPDGDADDAVGAQLRAEAKDAVLVHEQLRSAVDLPPNPSGEVVVRMVTRAPLINDLISTVAVRDPEGVWRIETVSAPFDQATGERRAPVVTHSTPTQAHAAELDKLLESSALYREPGVVDPDCFDGAIWLVEVRDHGRQRTALQRCSTAGETGRLIDLISAPG